MVKVSASVLSSGFTNDAIDNVKSADMLQLDVMDGEFVPNQTIDALFISDLNTNMIKDVHLMIMNPEEYVEEYIRAGADRIAFHIESTNVPESIIGLVKNAGVKIGIALNIETPVEKIFPFLDMLDYILIMSIHPGKSGQDFNNDVLQKIKDIKAKSPEIEIEVDGGINEKTGKLCVQAGANILVSDSWLHKGNIEENIKKLQSL